MLALFLIVLSFGSYCSSAPIEREEMRTRIKEMQSSLDTIKLEFQDLLTPTHKMEKKCTLKKLNIFIESVKSVKSRNANWKIKMLLLNLETIKRWVEEDSPELKESQPDCEGGQVGFEDFKKKLHDFLSFITENF